MLKFVIPSMHFGNLPWPVSDIQCPLTLQVYSSDRRREEFKSNCQINTGRMEGGQDCSAAAVRGEPHGRI